MSKLRVHITVSADGYVAGPNQTLEDPLGEGGSDLHEWRSLCGRFESRTVWKAAR
jgi:hypothetical protein